MYTNKFEGEFSGARLLHGNNVWATKILFMDLETDTLPVSCSIHLNPPGNQLIRAIRELHNVPSGNSLVSFSSSVSPSSLSIKWT